MTAQEAKELAEAKRIEAQRAAPSISEAENKEQRERIEQEITSYVNCWSSFIDVEANKGNTYVNMPFPSSDFRTGEALFSDLKKHFVKQGYRVTEFERDDGYVNGYSWHVEIYWG